MKLLAARTVGAYRLIANVNFEQEMGDNHSAGLALESQFQATRKMSEHINPGIEWHAQYGKLNKLEDSRAQEHYVGPIISGTLFTLGEHDLGYTLGYYWGLTNAAADNAARLQLGYEFSF